jgi:ABC-type nitrate/sulfonate/bicarbonate transport system substrate-binding protein
MMKSKIAKINLFVILFVLIFSTLLSACQPKAELQPIKYGGQLYPEEYLLVGDSEIWSHYGIQVEHTLFSSGTENNQALISGAVDVNIGSDSKAVSLFSTIPDEAIIIAVSQRGDRYSTLVKEGASYKTWYDLKGKTVGIRLGTGAEQVVRRYFQEAGDLKWEDFNWVDMKIEDMTAALENGSIEAFTAWEPTPAMAEAQGVGQVMMSYGDVALTPVFIMTTKTYASQHHDELVAFLAAHYEKVNMIKNDPANAAEIAAGAASASGTEVSPEIFDIIFQRVDFSLELDQATLDSLNDTAQFLLDLGEIQSIPKFTVDASYLEEAKKLYESKNK